MKTYDDDDDDDDWRQSHSNFKKKRESTVSVFRSDFLFFFFRFGKNRRPYSELNSFTTKFMLFDKWNNINGVKVGYKQEERSHSEFI